MEVPTYQYACTECGHRFEAVQSFSDAALTQCPVCEGRLRKQYGSVGVVFKGSGFYRTDSRRGAPGEGGPDGGAKKDGPKQKDGAAKKDGAASPAKESSGAPVAAGSGGSTSGASGSTGGSASS
jgi:putative FmdB family regulatory protein